MTHPNLTYLDEARGSVAEAVRSLRTEHRWTQKELAARLDMSQGRLSEVERGAGSFTAEQLLLLAQLFNVPISRFAPTRRSTTPSAHAELQNALARLGATDLQERDDVLPSERLAEVTRVVKEALVVGDPRLLAALAPVLVQHIDRVSLPHLWLELRDLGLERRLPWLAENVLTALRGISTDAWPRDLAAHHRRAQAALEFWLDAARRRPGPRADRAAADLLDASIRSQRTLDQVRASSSAISRRWGIATTLQPTDFAAALEAAYAAA